MGCAKLRGWPGGQLSHSEAECHPAGCFQYGTGAGPQVQSFPAGALRPFRHVRQALHLQRCLIGMPPQRPAAEMHVAVLAHTLLLAGAPVQT